MGFGAFVLFCLFVVLIAWLATWAIGYFAPSAPAIIQKIIWGVAVLIILVTLARAMNLIGHDVLIPRF